MSVFSNGFEFEAWQANWCARCVKEPDCLILTAVLLDELEEDEIPAEWSPGRDDLYDRYHCSEIEALPELRGT